MTEIDAEVKKWGNSLGIRVPASVAHEQGISPGDTVHVRIEKVVMPNPEFFGMAKRMGLRISIEDFMKSRNEERRRERARDRERAKLFHSRTKPRRTKRGTR